MSDTLGGVDPHGLDAHAPGAKLDGGKPRPTLILRDMRHALAAVVDVGTFGANKYSDGGWLHVLGARQRYTDAMMRHYLLSEDEPHDAESGLLHDAHLAWNALARLELRLREDMEREGTPPWPAPCEDPPECFGHYQPGNAALAEERGCGKCPCTTECVDRCGSRGGDA